MPIANMLNFGFLPFNAFYSYEQFSLSLVIFIYFVALPIADSNVASMQ